MSRAFGQNLQAALTCPEIDGSQVVNNSMWRIHWARATNTGPPQINCNNTACSSPQSITKNSSKLGASKSLVNLSWQIIHIPNNICIVYYFQSTVFDNVSPKKWWTIIMTNNWWNEMNIQRPLLKMLLFCIFSLPTLFTNKVKYK